LARSRFRQSTPAGLYIVPFNATKPIVSIEAGGFDPNLTIHVASATKLVTATIILRLVEKGFLTLDSKVGDYFPAQPPIAQISLHQLLSFQSGLVSKSRNTCKREASIRSCAERILREQASFNYQRGFDYNNAHLTVAAAMAERATNKSWHALVTEHLVVPLSLQAQPLYTDAVSTTEVPSPMMAGGLYISTTDYLRVVAGLTADKPQNALLSGSLRKIMFTNQISPITPILSSPFVKFDLHPGYRYGYGNWVECETSACSSARNSSAGYFGFYPWIDWEVGYYGVLATRGPWYDFGASMKSIRIVDALRPEIEAIVGREVRR
jgi:CubicO group peptidase (beta-lactamase class C family)